MYDKGKIIKIIIISVAIGLVILAGVIGFLQIKEKLTPEALQALEEAEKQEYGYYERIAELTEYMNQSSDYVATTIIDKIIEVIGSPKIDKIEKGGVRGNYTFYANDYVLDVFIRGKDLEDIRIGNCLIYKRIANSNDKSIIIQEKIYTFNEYDTIVNNLAKEMKIDKSVAAKNFMILSDIGINRVESIKKVKIEEPGKSKYKAVCMNIPMEITFSGETISKVEIVHSAISEISVYDVNSEESNQVLKNHIPVYGERKFIPESLAYQVGKLIGEGVVIRFPVALDDGDDSWLIVKDGNDLYIEITGDVTENGKTESKNFIIRQNKELNQITYLKVDRKVYVGEN